MPQTSQDCHNNKQKGEKKLRCPQSVSTTKSMLLSTPENPRKKKKEDLNQSFISLSIYVKESLPVADSESIHT
jgi:hypothetical protein